MQPKKTANKKVLLVSDLPVLGVGAIVHGLDFSSRMDASLEVLQLILPEKAAAAKQSFEANRKLSGRSEQIDYVQLAAEQEIAKELIAYAGGRRDLLCVVLCEQGRQHNGNKKKRRGQFENITKILNCPVVLYTEGAKQTGSQVY